MRASVEPTRPFRPYRRDTETTGVSLRLTSIDVRTATVADTQVIAELNGHVQALHSALVPDLFKPAVATTFTAADALALLSGSGNTVLLAFADGEPAGYAYVEARRRPETTYAYGYD